MNLAVNARDAMPDGGRSPSRRPTSMPTRHRGAHAGIQAGYRTCIWRSPTPASACDRRLAVAHLRALLHHQGRRERAPAWGSRPSTASSSRAGARSTWRAEPGCGTRFEIDLPQTEDAADVGFSSVPGRQQQTVERARETILLVEDDDAVRRLAREVLERSGYTVLKASNGREALEVEAQHERPIHALVTDVVMPEMGGIELSWRVRSRRPDIRILVTSGYDKHGSAAHLELPEGAVVLAKPFPVDSLLAKLRALLQA